MAGKFYDEEACRRKEDQHWEMAGLARQDGDHVDESQQMKKAQEWAARRREGGWQS